MFAMLFEIVSTFSCWASMPVAPIERLRIMVVVSGSWSRAVSADARQLVDRATRAVVFLIHHPLRRLVAAQQLDHGRDLEHALDVRALDHPLRDADVVARLLLVLSGRVDRKSTRLNSSHLGISYAVFCLKKKKKKN